MCIRDRSIVCWNSPRNTLSAFRALNHFYTLYDTLWHSATLFEKKIYAEIRYSFQEGSGLLPTIVLIQKLSFGLDGDFLRFKWVWCRSLSAFIKLHFLQHATTFDHSCRPPLERGTIWSTDSADLPQYWLSLIHIWRCRRSYACRSRWSPYH